MPTEENYLSQAQSLLPHGPAWTRANNANLTKLLSAAAAMFFAVDQRALVLAIEANPLNSMELLADWERVGALPDECSKRSWPKTIEERRNDLINLLNSNSSPTLAFFQGLAERLGYETDIEELKPFICGLSRCGDRLNGHPTVRYNMAVITVKEERVTYFRTGSACCGDRLGAIRYATELECIFNRLKPAHVVFIYGYE